jgi:hypothetical protein
VKEYEGAVEVKSCQRIGDAITDDSDPGYGIELDEVWKCAVKRDRTVGFVDACYVFHHAASSSIDRKLRCAAVGPGCPFGGHLDREAQTVFLGREPDRTLVYEESLGNDPAYKTVRVEVSYEATKGAREHCGYVLVRVPTADDADDPSQRPTALAAEIIETEWSDPHYSFSYSLIDD